MATPAFEVVVAVAGVCRMNEICSVAIAHRLLHDGRGIYHATDVISTGEKTDALTGVKKIDDPNGLTVNASLTGLGETNHSLGSKIAIPMTLWPVLQRNQW